MIDGTRSRTTEPQWRRGRGGLAWPVLVAIVIFFASGQGEVAAPGFVPSIDKLGHFAVFGLLATLVLRAIRDPGHPWRSALVALAAVSCYGIADEFRQSFTPGRSVEIADWVADTLGTAAAVAAYTGWPFWRELMERDFRRDQPLRAEAGRAAIPEATDTCH